MRRRILLAGLLNTLLVLAAGGLPAAESFELEVMSFNIRYGTARDGQNSWPKRKDLVFDVIRRAEPEIVGLQEALHFQIEEILAAFPAFERIGVGREDGKTKGEYAAILYRKDRFRRLDGSTFWLSDSPKKIASTSWGNNTTRICTWVRLEHRASRIPLVVYNTHFDHRSQESRERSAELIAKRIQGRAASDPFLILGDFNASESNRAIRYLKGEVRKASEDGPAIRSPALVDTFRVVHPDAKDVGTFNGWRGRKSGPKIDYILTPRWVRVRKAAIIHDMKDGRCPSDHFPVSARLVIPRVRTS